METQQKEWAQLVCSTDLDSLPILIHADSFSIGRAKGKHKHKSVCSCSAVQWWQSSLACLLSSPPIGLDLDNRLGLGLC